MRIVRPGESASAGRKRTPPRMHQKWFREWIEDQGKWALFACGHKANISARGTLIIQAFGKRDTQVFCERCQDFRRVKRLMNFNEYAGIPKVEIPEIPAF